ncbi:MAG: hypothetical protein KGL78_04655 [Burkholderiales bacterium]|nr:hypothetical protein [Burkholderiales bacterium]
MISSPDASRDAAAAKLEAPLALLEAHLAALHATLQQPDDAAIDRVAAELHGALAHAVDHFHLAARQGGVPPLLRRRLALAGAEVAAQREALARATASLDRAIEVLMPRAQASRLYSSAGASERSPRAGGLAL